jgi:alpha,alpha-trehalase
MTAWSLVYDDFDSAQERLREALCTLGNGYFATRGAAHEATADGVHYPGTYVAGCYNRLESRVAERIVENEDLVNLPNWLLLRFRVEGSDWFELADVEILSYRQELELGGGVLSRRVRFRDRRGRQTSFASRRFVHMRHRHLAALEVVFTAENWSGDLAVRSALDARVVNAGVERYRDLENRHLVTVEAGSDAEVMHLKVETNQSGIRIAQAARNRVLRHGQLVQTPPRPLTERDFVAHDLMLPLTEGVPLTVEKVVALYTSRDRATAECGLEARNAVVGAASFPDLLASHGETWRQLWRCFEIEIEQGEPDQGEHADLILRLHVFHLLQTTSPHVTDLDVGVPARGLHGEAYRGHVFWDELFIFPFLNLRMPEVTRALLRYRYRRLGEARAAARGDGYQGAMYPWQSGSNGREETQRLHLNPRSGRWLSDNSRLQRHVNSAIAYNVWSYFQVTRDVEFLSFYGAEMILEIARFWASLATYDPGLARYEIVGVVGPDEYHDAYPDTVEPGLRNNAYTNIMAVWVLCRALELLELLPDDRREELCEQLQLSRDEVERWDSISRKMRVVFHGDGVISQFEGYNRLEELDWEGYAEKYGDIQRLDRILESEGDSTNRYKVSKQADVLMLFYLLSSDELRTLFERLGYSFDFETIPRNIDYYTRRTSHGSTLSRIVHSWVLARSDRRRSWQLFIEALESDIADIQGGTTHEGIHLGAMAGTADLIARGYPGIETRGDVLWLSPCLPEKLRRLRLCVRYRGHPLELEVTRETLTVTTRRGTAEPVRLGIAGDIHTLAGGETRELPLRP